MRLICNIGVNDSPYNVNKTVDGKLVRCPIYTCWKDVIRRTSPEYQSKNKNLQSYTGCTIHAEWLRFSNFLYWANTRFVSGYDLDKDLIVQGNTHYSPETCVFIPHKLNTLFRYNRGPVGVFGVREKTSSSGNVFYEAYGSNKSKHVYLGLFKNIQDAHRQWQRFRITQLQCAIDEYPNIERRVVDAVNHRILMLEEDIFNGRITERL